MQVSFIAQENVQLQIILTPETEEEEGFTKGFTDDVMDEFIVTLSGGFFSQNNRQQSKVESLIITLRKKS